MHRLILLGWFLFLLTPSIAQEKITDFEGNTTRSIDGTYYADTIHNKLLFFVNMPEKYTSLWVSDGTKDGTRMLNDTSGESPQHSYRVPIKKYGYSYFQSGSIWKTDGDKLQRLPIGADSLLDFQLFANKLLIYCQYSIWNPDKSQIVVSSFGWLDSLDQVTIWEKDIVGYQIIDNALHYIKLNKTTQNYELHIVLPDGTHKINIISSPGTQIYNFNYFSKNNYDYYLFDTNQGWKLYSKSPEDETTAYLQQWGTIEWNYGIRRFIIKDTDNNEYLLKYSKIIQIFSFAKDGQLVERWSLPIEAFLADSDKPANYGNVIGNMSISGNELLYTNAYMSEGVAGFKLNVLNLSNYQHKRSKNLQDYTRFYYNDNFSISRLDRNVYVIDNNYGKKLTYSFALDSTLSITSYPYQSSIYADTLLTINRQKLLLTDNIYNVTTTKQPLIATREIFVLDQNPHFMYRALPNKLLFWKYNYVQSKNQLWASNGDKNGSNLLADLKGSFEYFYPENRLIQIDNKVYFVTRTDTEKGLMYETDGTKEGTKELFEVSDISYVRANQKQGVFVTIKREIFSIENGKVYQINNLPKSKFGFDVYVTDNQLFIVTNDATAENWSYSQLFLVKDGKAVFVDDYIGYLFRHKTKAFYTKRVTTTGYNIFNLYSVNEAGKVTEIEKGVKEAMIYGSRLVYQQFIAEDKPPKTTILDILTNKKDLVIDNFYVLSAIAVNDALLLMSEVKSLLIKGNKRIDISDISRNTEIIPFSKGFITKRITNPNSNGNYIFDFKYYSIEDETLTPIGTANDMNFNSKSNFVFVINYVDNITAGWSYWTPKDNKIIPIENQRSFFNIDSIYAFSNDFNGETTCWYFDGKYLTKRYKIDYTDKLYKVNNEIYLPYYSTATGTELARMGSEQLITYPEIVDGIEGIDIRSVWSFNNQLYLYGFTFTHGWQVWKMTKENPYPILSAEIIQENELLVYPNPVRDFLNIKSDKGFNFRLINIKGQELMKGRTDNGEVMDLMGIPTGVYIIQFFDGSKVYSKKVIKN